MGIMARKGLTKFMIARLGPPQKIFLLACCFMRLSGEGVRPTKKGA